MNRILNIIAALVAVVTGCFTASAQGEVPLVREGVKWHYKMRKGYSSSDHIYIYHDYVYFQGNKEIDGKQYSICHRGTIPEGYDTIRHYRPLYLRQEGKKVYLRYDSLEHYFQRGAYYQFYPEIYDLHLPVIDKECLLYDFSLNEGESWKMLENNPTLSENDISDNDGTGNTKLVDSVRNITICGVPTKLQYIRFWYLRSYGGARVIEGIGPMQESFLAFPYITANKVIGQWIIYELVELQDMNGNVLHDFSGVNSVVADNSGLRYEENTLSVSAEGTWTVTVYGSDGRKVMQRSGYGPDAIALDNIGTGVYIARLQTASAAKTLKLMR